MIYMLAEPQKTIIEKVYSGSFTQPKIDYLFDNTELASIKEEGPVLVSDPIVETSLLTALLEKNSGLLITSQYSQEELLTKLRHLLLINFKPEQVGIFRYYDPYVASYFFPSLQEQQIADWLGPIQKIQWFNTNWRDRTTTPDHWQELINPHANHWQPNAKETQTKPVLDVLQDKALQRMQQEKFAYYWQQDPAKNNVAIDIDTAISWVEEGINNGFTKQRTLNEYLSIRSKYPNTVPPTEWPSESITERTTYLETYLAQNHL